MGAGGRNPSRPQKGLKMHRKCKRCLDWQKDYDKDVSCDACPDGTYKNTLNFITVDTVNFKHYKVNGGNVSKARVDMIKNRTIHPDGNGEVVLKSKTGKITNRLAGDY